MPPKDFSHIEQKDSVDLLYYNMNTGLASTFLAATIFVFAFPHGGSLGTLQFGWWMAMCALLALRGIDMLYYYRHVRHTTNDFEYGRAFARFTIGILLTSVFWASYALYMIPYASVPEVAVFSIILSAFAGGAANLLSGSRKISILYSSILTIPFTIALIIANEPFYNTLGLLALTFAIIMLLSANKSALFTAKAIHLKHQNDHLLAHMEHEVVKRTKEIYSLSNSDPLTGLYNRKAFVEKLDYRLLTQPNIKQAILFIDLDGFKTINDSLGHEIGDHVIREAGKRILQSSHASDLVCRWGGDEFLLALEQNDQVIENAQKLIETISEPYLMDGSKLSIGATIGVSYYPAHGNDHERLIQRADMAMYHQKRAQKGGVGIFDESLREQLLREIRLRDHLENAIHRHELFLVFQPILEAKTNRIAAVEALLRWRLDNEYIPPDEFINIAEQYGFIKPIGLWVLGEACMAGKRLQQLVPDLSVCVNVSIQQLLDENFPEDVKATLERTDFRPENLHLEITESLFAHDKHRLIENISRLKKVGIEVSIDDFGTGYSSLSVMQEFDVDLVKIDRTFIWTMDQGGRAIVEAVSQIASSFGYQVVAEGVETEEQKQILTDMGIDYLQGYLFLHPVTEEEMVEHLNTQAS